MGLAAGICTGLLSAFAVELLGSISVVAVWPRQAPPLQTCPLGQVAPSSTVPLQLLSNPSHTSAEGFTLRTQVSTPLMHWVVPAEHTPDCPVLQAMPPPGFPSSTCPLQLLSSPSHTSALALWLGTQIMAPPTHWVVPDAQTPS